MVNLNSIAKNITVDYDHSTVTIDDSLVPYMLAAPGPIVTANADPDCTMGTVTVSLFAEEITVRGVPTPGTARPHTGATLIRLWDQDWQLIGDIDEGWRADEPFAVTLHTDHPIARVIMGDEDRMSVRDRYLTIDRDGQRVHRGRLHEWQLRRTRLGDLLVLAFEEAL